MLLLVMLALAAVLVLYIIQDHSKIALFVAGIHIGLILLIFTYILIWTKNGGIQSSAQFALFLTPAIRRRLLYLPISASAMSRILLLGKSLFLCSSMVLAVSIRRFSRRSLNVILYSVSIIIPVLNLVLLNPKVYLRYCSSPFFRQNQVIIFNSIRVIYVLCLVFCVGLMIRRYTLVRIDWIKRQVYQIIWCNISFYLLFVLLGVLGPVQVSDFTGIHYITANFLYMGSKLPWILITFASVGLTMVGSRALIKFSHISRQIGQPDISIDKKLKDSNASVRMFTHGMKNQLLVLRAMIKDLQRDYSLPNEVMDRLGEINQVSQSMLERMDELYSTFKNDAMKLGEIPEPFEIMNSALKKLGTCAIPIQTECIEQCPILADAPHLSEAIYNILKNAVDAVQGKPSHEEKCIKMRMYIDHNDLVFEVQDFGEGIDPKNLRKIFEPFYTSKNSGTNWGIGLPYVQQVVKGHGGHLSIDSQLGVGTTIYLTVPAYGEVHSYRRAGL